MIRAHAYPNLEEDFAQFLDAQGAAPLLHLILVRALTPRDGREPTVLPRGFGSAMDLVTSKFRSAIKSCGVVSFETDMVHMNHGRATRIKNRPNCTALPVLIIDGLVKSDANKNFVNKLYNEAFSAAIMVLILVKEPDWATEIIGINGGVHILPVDGVISNPRISVGLSFTDAPLWTMMRWKVEDLRNFANLVGIRGVQIREDMTPQQLLDLQNDAIREQDGDGSILYGV